MHVELSVALNFLMSYLYNKLPRRRVDVFAEELQKGLLAKFQDHWYPEDSFKGSGFRSIRIVEGKIDPVFKMASQSSGLSLEEILEQLPRGLTIWIDPDEVSYRIGETGQVTILYYNNKRNIRNPTNDILSSNLINHAPCGNSIHDNISQENEFNVLMNGFATKPKTSSMNTINNFSGGFSPCDHDLAMSLEKLRLESSNSFNNGFSYMHASPATLPNVMSVQNGANILGLPKTNVNQTCFTAAAFAQTKFGSTKMKTHSNHQTRPTKLFSPPSSDIHTRLNLAAQLNALSARSPGSFIPLGLHSQLAGPWSSVNQTSAPSSCLGSPCSDFIPTSTNQMFANLFNQSNNNDFSKDQRTLNIQPQHLFEGLQNNLLTNCGSNVNNASSKMSTVGTPLLTLNEISSLSLTSQSETFVNPNITPSCKPGVQSFKPNSPFQQQPALKNDQLMNDHSSLSISKSPKSSSMSSPDNSPPVSVDSVDWNNYISTCPNLQHLLVAN